MVHCKCFCIHLIVQNDFLFEQSVSEWRKFNFSHTKHMFQNRAFSTPSNIIRHQALHTTFLYRKEKKLATKCATISNFFFEIMHLLLYSVILNTTFPIEFFFICTISIKNCITDKEDWTQILWCSTPYNISTSKNGRNYFSIFERNWVWFEKYWTKGGCD